MPLIEGLAGSRSPAQSIRRPFQADHADPMLFGITAGIPRDDDVIAILQGVSIDVLSAQLAGPAPLDSPTLHDALCIRRVDLNERMWITELELNQGSFNL